MTRPESQETGEFFKLPRLFTSLGGLTVQRGKIVPPLSDGENYSCVLEDMPLLEFDGKRWQITYIPPYDLDGEAYGDMVDVTYRDKDIKKSISFFREPGSDKITTMVTVEPSNTDGLPKRKVTLEEQAAAHKALDNLFTGASYEGEDVERAEDRILFMIGFDSEASPEDLFAVEGLERRLSAHFTS